MDKIKLQKTAEDLDNLLAKYGATNTDAANLRRSLSQLIDAARHGRINAPVPWQDIPGHYLFMEGSLGQFTDLENAFAHFKFAITDLPIMRP